MSIPLGTPLDDLTSALRLQEPADRTDWKALELAPVRLREGGDRTWLEAAIVAWYPARVTATPEALISRIRKELDHKNHASTDGIAKAILGLLCIRRSSSRTATEALNDLLGAVSEVEFHEYLIAAFPPHPDVQDFEIENFRIGRLNREKLVYLCERVQCDYFTRYPDHYRNRFAIERRGVKGIALRAWDIGGQCVTPAAVETIEYKVIDNYFKKLSEDRQERFRQEVMEAQFVPIAAGANVVDVTDANFWFGSSFVCVVTWIREKFGGYFCPLGNSANIDFASVDKSFRTALDSLRKLYGFEGLGRSEIHGLIQTFCRFVSLAAVRKKATAEESLLQYVIALDLVFGERDASNQSVARRVAVISAPQLGTSIEAVMNQMKRLYDVRSKYVHRGQRVPQDAVGEVKPLVDSVFGCLMRLQMRRHAHEPKFIDSWLKELDRIHASHEAGKPVSKEELVEAGIIKAGA
jgi:hypothetical protein